jgi:hypothetical protein
MSGTGKGAGDDVEPGSLQHALDDPGVGGELLSDMDFEKSGSWCRADFVVTTSARGPWWA